MKKLTPKTRKIVDIVVTSIEVIVVLFAIVLSAIIIANPNQSTTEVAKGNVKLLPVMSDSMVGDKKDNFKKGDLIVAKSPKDVLKLKENDIVTFKGSVNGYDALITHRIIEVVRDSDGNAMTYVTHGDSNPYGENETVNPYNVVAVYNYHLKGVGSAISWLQDSTHFLLVIVLPLGLLFIWNIVMFVRMLMQWKMEKAGKTTQLDEEEIKRRAIEEFLASQNANNATGESETPSNDIEN